MSRREHTRRALLRSGLAAGVGAVAVGRAGAREPEHVPTFESEGGGLAGYKFTASGRIEQTDRGDTVDRDWARGYVGPVRGVDTFRYSGELTGLTVAGPVAAYRDGELLDRDAVDQTSGSIQLQFADTPPTGNVVRIEGGGGRPSVYEFRASGAVEQRDAGDFARDGRAVGHVGAERGTDVFEYAGDITEFRFVGPGRVVHNGTVHETVYD
ncbi:MULTISPECIES: hypothetical protein [Halorussus]|uniref:hypothetical protein n=1 Tax=Halorussus TaxID=1070314 RepID=UPI000E214051|nr:MULTISPECIES: hypothetical protein [Halorussus]NHN60263.1 hypothetical protein [Halorussus sp. JP-T4]